MLRLTALALFGLALAAGCSGRSQPFSEGEAGEGSGARSTGGSGGAVTNGGTSGAAGNATGGVGASSGASGDGGTMTGGASTGGAGTGGVATGGAETGGSDTGGSDTGGTDAGGKGGAQGGDAGLGGIGARAGASGSTSMGGAAGATMTDPRCPLHKPDLMTNCESAGLRCAYDPTGCRCLSLIGDRCYAVDSCVAVNSGDRVAPPPAQICVCVSMDRQVWDCAAPPL